jgi:hypothetical protein
MGRDGDGDGNGTSGDLVTGALRGEERRGEEGISPLALGRADAVLPRLA